MTLPRYAAYRPIDVEWLAEVPQVWQVCPLRHLVRFRSGGTPSKENLDYWNGDVPWASAKDLKTETLTRTEDMITAAALHDGAAELVPAGAVLVVVRGMILARTFPVAQALVPMAINQDLKAVLAGDRLYAPFLAWLLRGCASDSLRRLDEAGHGTKALRMDAWSSMLLPLPSVPEQVSIAAFLGRETAKIDALIAEQEKLIVLLAEKRQATISHSVTRGLDPDVPLKNSGVPWIGAVPVHWELPPLYLRYTTDLGKMLDSGRITGHHLVPYLRNVDVQWDAVNLDDLPCMDISADEYERYTVRDGDLLVCEGGEVGRSAVVTVGSAVVGYQKALHRLRAASDQEHPRYMFYTLAWAAKAGAFAGEGQSTIAHLTGEQLRKYRLPKPPLCEQVAIASYLDGEAERLDSLSEESARAVTLLKERRSALITAAVTGQIDVRGAAGAAQDQPQPTGAALAP